MGIGKWFIAGRDFHAARGPGVSDSIVEAVSLLHVTNSGLYLLVC